MILDANDASKMINDSSELLHGTFPEGQKSISILGITGSIGINAAEVLRAFPEKFSVEAIVANSNFKELAIQAKRLNVSLAVIADERYLPELRELLVGCDIETAGGKKAVLEAMSRPVDIVIAAIVGSAGLEPTLAAMKTGANIALANKECLVTAGDYFMSEAKKLGSQILPVDSEHSAIFQALHKQDVSSLEKITLTASGGPFRKLSINEMAQATPEAALKHPNWSMGRKISIDSATMMNKGLELIEAHHLFNVSPQKLDVLVHPQSIVHGLVEFVDGAVLAQLGAPDMRTPIAVALSWPLRISAPAKKLSFKDLSELTFETPDEKKFPSIALARQAMLSGSTACAAYNAANEIAVEAFLEKKIGFLDIASIVNLTIEQSVKSFEPNLCHDLATILEFDSRARAVAQENILKFMR